jgi:hypothetical protein
MSRIDKTGLQSPGVENRSNKKERGKFGEYEVKVTESKNRGRPRSNAVWSAESAGVSRDVVLDAKLGMDREKLLETVLNQRIDMALRVMQRFADLTGGAKSSSAAVIHGIHTLCKETDDTREVEELRKAYASSGEESNLLQSHIYDKVISKVRQRLDDRFKENSAKMADEESSYFREGMSTCRQVLKSMIPNTNPVPMFQNQTTLIK